mgnify:CR=1 FL=1
MQRRGHHNQNNSSSFLNNDGGWGGSNAGWGGSNNSSSTQGWNNNKASPSSPGWNKNNSNTSSSSSSSGWNNNNDSWGTPPKAPPTTTNASSWNNQSKNNWNASPAPGNNTKKFSNPPPPPPPQSKKQEEPKKNPWIAPDLTEAANVIAPGMASNPLAQMAATSIAQYGNSTISRYIPGVMVFWNAMRHHFNVDNKYVKKKLGLLLFPKQKSWNRMTMGGPSHDNAPLHADGTTSGVEKKTYLPPTQDVNAPDLYIPIMAFTTYVVMIGLLKGTVGEFTPDVLSQVMMSSLFMECLEVLLIRVGFTITRVPPENISSMDILSWSFYKYVGLCLTTLSYLFAGELAYYLVLLYTSLALAWFYMCTFKGLYGGAFRLSVDQKYFLFGVSAMQPVLMYWMSSYP